MAIRTVTTSDQDDSNHSIPEDIEGRLAKDDPVMEDHEDGDGERWDLAGHVDGCSMMIIRNMQASYQTIWSIGFIVDSTASTSESLFELSYRIPKLFT